MSGRPLPRPLPQQSLLLLLAGATVLVLLVAARPVTADSCASCVHGACNATIDVCTCYTGYNGTDCNLCDAGYTVNEVTGHDLPLNEDTNATMTPSICISHCSALTYAGIQNGDQCWCGSTYGKYGQTPSDSWCNITCPGDPTKDCGGYSLNSIYKVSDGSYVGCYYDAINGTTCYSTPPTANPGVSTPTPVINTGYAQMVLYIVFSLICVIFGGVTITVLVLWLKAQCAPKDPSGQGQLLPSSSSQGSPANRRSAAGRPRQP